MVQACWHERLNNRFRCVDGQWTYVQLAAIWIIRRLALFTVPFVWLKSKKIAICRKVRSQSLTAYFSTNSYLLGLDGHLVLFLSICQPCTSSFLCVLCILFRRLCSGLENFIKTIFSNRLYLNGDEVKTFARHGHLNAIQCLAPPSPAFIFDVTAQVDDVHGHRIPSLYQVWSSSVSPSKYMAHFPSQQ